MANEPVTSATADDIERIIEEWRPRLATANRDAVRSKPSADRWSIIEVVGHLVDSACNNHQRFVRAQFCNELVFPKYDQNQWVAAAQYAESDWDSVVELWLQYNRQLAVLIRNMSPSALRTTCTIEPYEPCTLEFLITDYVVHLRHHLKILAWRLEEADA